MRKLSGLIGLSLPFFLGCGGAQKPIEVVGRPLYHEAMVTSAEGSAVVQVGMQCVVSLERTDDDVYNCRVEVRCGDETLYGLPGAGFNRCVVRGGRFVAAEDAYRTRTDGDPYMRFDLEHHQAIIEDSAPDFRVTVGLAAR
jgi:hypothetical protein